VSGQPVHEAFFVSASRIALRASPQTEFPSLWINFRNIHRLTVTGACDARHHIPFDLSVLGGNEVSF